MIRPQISINFAITADGKIASAQKENSPFSSKLDLERLWKIRKTADAIMVGRGTLEADKMSLTIPESVNPHKQPLRIIVSRTGDFNWEHPIFHSEGGKLHLLVTESAQSSPPKTPSTIHHQSLSDFLETAKLQLGIKRLLCEGGGELAHALFKLDVVDTVHLTFASHILLGGSHAPTITGVAGDFLPASLQYELTHFEPNEAEELFLTYERIRASTSS